MILPYVIDGERRSVQVMFPSTASGRDIALTIEALYRDPGWQPGFDVIWNCASASELIFEADDIDALVSVRRTMADAGGAGRDIIIIKRILDDGMARMYAAMRTGDRRRTQLCASEKTALEILARSSGAEPI